MTNVDVDWSVSLDSGDTWELFGGEVIKFSGVGNACDSVTLHADNSEDLDWQTVDDDVLSVCLSAASSRSCLHSSGPHETYSEMYGDKYKPEGDVKFDRLLSDELISDIMSSMDDNLPISLERFHEINHLVDCAVKIAPGDAHDLLLNDMIEVLSNAESVASDDGDSEMTVDTLQLCPNTGTDPNSPDSGVASLECEELYEESVTAGEVVQSTLSCRDLHDLMANSCKNSIRKCELSHIVGMAQRQHQHPATELTNRRRMKKKEQNKTAALRYRLKKRSEQGLVMTEYSMLERKNIELRTRLDAMTKEISYLKSLIDELCS